MTAFLVFAALFVAVALLFLLPPLLRARTLTAPASADANAAVYREQLEELLADVQKGAISREEYERAAGEVERRIVAENAGAAAPEPAQPRRAAATALAVALFVPVIAGLGYWQLGVPQALDPQALQRVDAGDMQALVEKLTARLQKEPQDLEGWKLLGQAQFALEQPERAAQAFARALQLAPQDRDVLLGLLRSLAMAGHFRFEKGDYTGAIGLWEKILGFAPPDSEIAKTVKEGIAEAQALAAQHKPAAGAAGLTGTVRLSPELAARIAPGDTVFVLARAADGPRMPLAVARTTADKLPYRFSLDDSTAMSPGATISSQKNLVVVARISRSGKATPAKGDIEGSSKPVAPGADNIEVVLSRVVE